MTDTVSDSERDEFFRQHFGVTGNKPIKEDRKTSGGHLVMIDGVPVRGRTPAQIERWIDMLEQGGWPHNVP